jgi:hypothetical protein
MKGRTREEPPSKSSVRCVASGCRRLPPCASFAAGESVFGREKCARPTPRALSSKTSAPRPQPLNASSKLSAPSYPPRPLSAPASQRHPLSSKFSAPSSQLQVLGPKLSAPRSQLRAPRPKLGGILSCFLDGQPRFLNLETTPVRSPVSTSRAPAEGTGRRRVSLPPDDAPARRPARKTHLACSHQTTCPVPLSGLGASSPTTSVVLSPGSRPWVPFCPPP